MTSRTLSPEALKTISDYLHFTEGTVEVAVPYYNNKRTQVRAGLRGLIGKGSITDIKDELTLVAFREKADLKKMSSSEFKQYLVKHNIGIDCSGFAFYILDTESKVTFHKSLASQLAHPFNRSLLRKLISRFRPVENTGVVTFGHDSNSTVIPLRDVRPGDFISMLHDGENKKNDHIIVIHEVISENEVPTKLNYSHSMRWPSDGEYNHGARQGSIEITDASKPITEQRWIENGKTGAENFTRERAVNATKAEIRRLKWFN